MKTIHQYRQARIKARKQEFWCALIACSMFIFSFFIWTFRDKMPSQIFNDDEGLTDVPCVSPSQKRYTEAMEARK